MSSTFGTLLKVSTFGESHCKGVGAIVDGVPAAHGPDRGGHSAAAGSTAAGAEQLYHRPQRSGSRSPSSPGRKTALTLGTPIGLFVANRDQRPGDYRR